MNIRGQGRLSLRATQFEALFAGSAGEAAAQHCFGGCTDLELHAVDLSRDTRKCVEAPLAWLGLGRGTTTSDGPESSTNSRTGRSPFHLCTVVKAL